MNYSDERNYHLISEFRMSLSFHFQSTLWICQSHLCIVESNAIIWIHKIADFFRSSLVLVKLIHLLIEN